MQSEAVCVMPSLRQWKLVAFMSCFTRNAKHRDLTGKAEQAVSVKQGLWEKAGKRGIQAKDDLCVQ